MTSARVSNFPEQTGHRTSVAAAVRAHMAVRQIKDAALAREVGMSQSKMSRRTNGDIAFDVDELGRIAEYFGVTLAQLISMPVMTQKAPQANAWRASLLELDSNQQPAGGQFGARTSPGDQLERHRQAKILAHKAVASSHVAPVTSIKKAGNL